MPTFSTAADPADPAAPAVLETNKPVKKPGNRRKNAPAPEPDISRRRWSRAENILLRAYSSNPAAIAELQSHLLHQAKSGRSVLHISAANAPAALRALLADGADPNARDAAGRTPLHAAAKAWQVANMVALLALPRLECDVISEDGTALALWLANRNPSSEAADDVAATLVRRGASLDAIDTRSGRSCMELLRAKKEGWSQTLTAAAERGRRL